MSAVVYPARRIITMDSRRPFATHIAVRDGRIVAVGSVDDIGAVGPNRVDRRFVDHTILPGLIEGHAHVHEGGMWNFVYTGYFDRRDPDGNLWSGLRSPEAVIARLRDAQAALAQSDKPLIAWGHDPIYWGGRRLTRYDLDAVSSTRPIVILHASLHLMTVNSPMLERAGLRRGVSIEGVPCLPDGEPSGELREFAAMYFVKRVIGDPVGSFGSDASVLWRYAALAQRAGVTTTTDLNAKLDDAQLANYLEVTADDRFPVRLVPLLSGAYHPPRDGALRASAIAAKSTDKLRLGMVKLFVDGSIQGFTARIRSQSYYNGAPNGQWITSPQELTATVDHYHSMGLRLHIHNNGDEATEVALDALEAALTAHPRHGHGHTLQHCQMADEMQFKRMARLGIQVNLFANHIYYWGDVHYSTTLGPEVAERMDACAMASRCGVNFSVHSDASITPLSPLFTAWCAANRVTASGRVLGRDERIGVPQALHAITLGAARTLGLENEVGSLDVGTRADLVALEEDPLDIDPRALRDVRVRATALGGRVFEA